MLGVDVSAVAYNGETIETLWWKAYSNPCRLEGAAFATARKLLRRLPARQATGPLDSASESLTERLTRRVAELNASS